MRQDYYRYHGKLCKVLRVDEKQNWPHTMLELEWKHHKGTVRYPIVKKMRPTETEEGEPTQWTPK